MNKIVLISGSNRKGNIEYILSAIKEQILESELILLRNKKIDFCKGCLRCHQVPSCILQDDMSMIIEKIKEAKLVVFGIPNYFDNVSGLFKNFIDRLHPLYKSEELKNKKVIFIFVGGGKEEGTMKSLKESVHGFIKYLQLEVEKEFSFKALNSNDMKQKKKEIEEIIEYIKTQVI